MAEVVEDNSTLAVDAFKTPEDVQEAYRARCASHRVKVNSIVGTLPHVGELEKLDLSHTLVGAKGLKPLVELVRTCPSLHTLNLRSQQLNSEAVQEMAETLRGHPGLTLLDISGNHCPVAGPTLVELVKSAPKLITLHCTDCEIRPLFGKLITLQLNKNRELQGIEAALDANEEEASGPIEVTTTEKETEKETPPPPKSPVSNTLTPRTLKKGSFSQSFTFGNGAEEKEVVLGSGVERAERRRMTVFSERYTDEEIDSYTPPVYEKSAEALNFLAATMEHIHLYSHLDDREILLAAQAMKEEVHSMGATLRTQGDDGSGIIAILYTGSLESISDAATTDLRRGDSFGEVQLLHSEKEPSTITVTSTEAVVFIMPREVYKRIVAHASKRKRETYGAFLLTVGFLANMKRSHILQLADMLKAVKVKKGEVIISYGDPGQWFYLILEGDVEVIGRDADGANVNVCTFKAGDCIGELEFINNHNCVADVKATSDVRMAKLNRKHFEMFMGPVMEILRNNAQDNPQYEHYRTLMKEKEVRAAQPPEEDEEEAFGVFPTDAPTDTPELPPLPSRNCSEDQSGRGRRGTISAEVISDTELSAFQCRTIDKPAEVTALIVTVLERLPLFCHLEDFEVSQLAGAMQEMKFAKDEVIIEAGQEGDMFHLLFKGEVTGEDATQMQIEYKPGQFFGEVVLMYSQPQTMTFTATSHEVSTYTLDRTTYKAIMQISSMKKRQMYGDFLKKVRFLKSCDAGELLQLADALKPCSYRAGERLIQFGDEGTWFYIIVDGTVVVQGRDQALQVTSVCEFTVGDCVGELEFINNHKCVADVQAKTNVRAAKMHRHHFEMCMGPILNVLRRQADTNEEYQYYREALAGQQAPVEESVQGKATEAKPATTPEVSA